jgi:predicted phage tail protein
LANGTYYRQARAQTASGTFDADDGIWWSFTVGGQAPAAFAKLSPANGTTGLGSAVTLTWGAASGATGYQVCYDTTNDGACAGSWVSTGTATSSALSGLAAGTYYWQVRAQNAAGTTDADGGTWWSFAVAGSAPPGALGKVSPATGTSGLGSAVTLTWGASTGAIGYAVCVDQTNDSACGTAWQTAGAATTFALSGLANGLYYWQVRAQNAAGTTAADGGTWWSFRVGTAPPTFTKLTPANGASGLSGSVTLTWSALTDAGYWVCWDTTNNNTCDGTWWPNGGGAARALSGLANGTYYWQARAQTASGTFDADDGVWWSFTVGGPPQPPGAFGKVAPASGASGLAGSLTLTWGSSASAASYELCVDTTNDGACSTSWQASGATTSFGLSGLAAGTYYWQVRAVNVTGTTAADGGTWWSFSVSATPPLFGKLAPANGATDLGSAVTLSWSALTDAGYWVCWDTTNNGACDGPWWPNGAGTSRALSGLAPGTYYWQILAQRTSGTVAADNGTWWTFTVR